MYAGKPSNIWHGTSIQWVEPVCVALNSHAPVWITLNSHAPVGITLASARPNNSTNYKERAEIYLDRSHPNWLG